MKTSLVGPALACLLLAGAAPAQRAPADASLGPAANTEHGYFKTAPIDGKAVIGPPPAAGGAEAQADQAIFEQTRALEGSPRWKTAVQDNDLWTGGALQRFSCALGVDVNAKQTPTLWRMLHRLEVDVRLIGAPTKQFYDRKRPMLGNSRAICVAREDWMRTNASYPSGHAMTAWSWGLIMAEAYPTKATEALALARDSAQSRVVCGVHYQSDVDAGRLLGSAMVASLHDVPEFRADLATAKKELAAAKGKPTGCGA